MDTTKIEGYDTMTAEQKVAALEAMETDYTGYVKKEVLDKAASEAANYKKQLRERQSAEEIAESERQAKAAELESRYTDLESKYNELQKVNVANGYKMQLLALGYDDKLAGVTATAMANGDMNAVFANQAKFMAEREKSLKADALKSMSSPKGGEDEKPEDSAIEMARRIGKTKATTGKASADVLQSYMLK